MVVLDYGSGNLRSAERALARAGTTVTVTADRDAALAADGLVVPGVGAFAACMAGLLAVGGDEVIAKRRIAGRPTLAICVGHQVLFEAGIEHGVRADGCGVWPGWSSGSGPSDCPTWAGTRWRPARAAVCSPGSSPSASTSCTATGCVRLPPAPDRVASWAEHEGDRFLAAVEEGPLVSTQFHPEKSGNAGARLLANWVSGL